MRPRGTVAIIDEAAQPYARMREEHSDVWLRLAGFGYEALGDEAVRFRRALQPAPR